MYAGNDKWSIDLRVQLLHYSPSEFSILISHVDVYDEGLYTCSFQTQDKPHTSQVYLIVHAVTVNEGSNVNLLCLAVGKPEPTVIWRQLKDGFTSEGEYLEISEINREQAGEYECVTANGVLTPDSKHVLITVNYPPIITDVKDSHPLVGKTALLRCEAMAVPAADFQWFKDDKQLTSGLDGLQIQNERTRSILLFTNVTARHYGNYTCLASNSLGSYNVSLRLISYFRGCGPAEQPRTKRRLHRLGRSRSLGFEAVLVGVLTRNIGISSTHRVKVVQRIALGPRLSDPQDPLCCHPSVFGRRMKDI
ncbi:hypothetical protein Chor_005320 [Crotalus horridus]